MNGPLTALSLLIAELVVLVLVCLAAPERIRRLVDRLGGHHQPTLDGLAFARRLGEAHVSLVRTRGLCLEGTLPAERLDACIESLRSLGQAIAERGWSPSPAADALLDGCLGLSAALESAMQQQSAPSLRPAVTAPIPTPPPPAAEPDPGVDELVDKVDEVLDRLVGATVAREEGLEA